MLINPEFALERITKLDYPIAEIIDGPDNGEFLYLHAERCCKKSSVKCREDRKCCKKCLGVCGETASPLIEYVAPGDSVLELFPNPKKPAFLFVFGPNECGKSYLTKDYCLKYQDLFPDNKVYLVSYVDQHPDDPNPIDEIPDLVRLSIPEIICGSIDGDKLRNSIVIFDDIDVEPEKSKCNGAKPKDAFKCIMELRDQLLTKGRHCNVSVIVTSHRGANKAHTAVPLNECGTLVFFRGGNSAQSKYVLKTYCGFDKQISIDRLMALPSRWVAVARKIPFHVIHQKGAFFTG